MLSYRHSYHAGNFADVLKHLIQVEILTHLCKKEAPFVYIDTHAGAGIYDLTSEHATKKQEYKNGIAKLKRQEWQEIATYLTIVEQQNLSSALQYYPGSPKVAECFLRDEDHAWLFELHPTDYIYLSELFFNKPQFKVSKEDGLKGLLSLVPPLAKRAFVLIDPAYEVKTDYQSVIETIIHAHKKFPSGIYALWYPVVERERVNTLEQSLIKSGIKKIEVYELSIKADSKDWGMTGAGMIVINPPWTLLSKMKDVLPKLSKTLGETGQGQFRCLQLVGE